MSFKESVEGLVGVAAKIAKLGIEEKTPQPRLVEPMSWQEVARLNVNTKLERQDFLPGDDGLLYLKNTESNRELIDRLYTSYLSKTGTTPIVRTKTFKNGQTVIDLPLLHAQREIASSPEFRVRIPELYGAEPDEKGELDFCKIGLENQELMAKFALAQIPSIHIQERLERSATFSGRIKNVEEDAIGAVKVVVPIVASFTLKLDKELHQELKVASGQIGGVASESAKQLGTKTINVLGEASKRAMEIGDDNKQVDLITDVIARLAVIGLKGSKQNRVDFVAKFTKLHIILFAVS
ncbi:hypothetical protein HZB78_00370 [Candidatus Collierbacteria bacterium]|nr:hypothetical protein [Candidatus Collierbacteria bacterium]